MNPMTPTVVTDMAVASAVHRENNEAKSSHRQSDDGRLQVTAGENIEMPGREPVRRR